MKSQLWATVGGEIGHLTGKKKQQKENFDLFYSVPNTF
jgi:hypothetical protein